MKSKERSRQRALEILATFNPRAIKVSSRFIGWDLFFVMVAEAQKGREVYFPELVDQLENIGTANQEQHRWIAPLTEALQDRI